MSRRAGTRAACAAGSGGCCTLFADGLLERRPLAVDAFLLDRAEHAVADVELLENQLARIGHAHRLVLGLDQGAKDLPALFFGRTFLAMGRRHNVTPSNGTLS